MYEDIDFNENTTMKEKLEQLNTLIKDLKEKADHNIFLKSILTFGIILISATITVLALCLIALFSFIVYHLCVFVGIPTGFSMVIVIIALIVGLVVGFTDQYGYIKIG